MADQLVGRRGFLHAAGVASAAAALPRLARSGDGPVLNVLLITSEDNGPELGCYGDPYARTPHLDRLAAEGARFQNAYVTNSVCSPSRGTIFTGLYPHQNGQIGLATHKYAMYRKWPNVVSLLKGAGYRTGIIGKIHVNPESAFPCDTRALPTANFGMRDMRRFAAAAGKFVTASPKPFFLMVNFPDAHFPLIKQYAGLPEKPLGAKDVKPMPFIGVDSERIRGYVANYYNCLSRLDSGMGMLLDVLKQAGVADNTLVIYLGDHGAQFSRGKTSVYEGGMRVPLMVRWPKATKAGVVRHDLVSSIDILPTILDATAVKGPGNLPGRSLLPLCRDEKIAWREYLFTEKDGATPFWTFPRRTVRDKRYKLILTLLADRSNPVAEGYASHFNAGFKAGATRDEVAQADATVQKAYARWDRPARIELYDLQADPYEWTDLAADPALADVKARLLKALEDWRKQTGDPFVDADKLARYVEEMDRVWRTRKMGYRKDKTFRWRYLDTLPDVMQ